jgi:small conductance mechanosensitive channel
MQSLDVDRFQLRMVARTLPGKQFDVGAALRIRIAAELLREGINVPTGLETGELTGPETGEPTGPETGEPTGLAGSD